ncbi:MAG: hypothetical protein ACHQRM_17950 [Bacteroidia bacterium]
MNKIQIVLLFTALTFNLGNFTAQSCTGFHKKSCKSGAEEGWVYNSQSKSGLFEEGMSSEIKIVIFKDFDYAMTLCNEKALGKRELSLTIKDAKTGEMIYDNNTDDKLQHVEFTCAATRSVIVTVTAPGGDGGGSSKGNDAKKVATKTTTPKSGEMMAGGCVGLLIEHKASSKQGF